MSSSKTSKEDQYKDPNEDSMVTDTHLGGKKVDASPGKESDKPAEDTNLVTQVSQKGKKVDADPEKNSDKPLPE